MRGGLKKGRHTHKANTRGGIPAKCAESLGRGPRTHVGNTRLQHTHTHITQHATCAQYTDHVCMKMCIEKIKNTPTHVLSKHTHISRVYPAPAHAHAHAGVRGQRGASSSSRAFQQKPHANVFRSILVRSRATLACGATTAFVSTV